ncbi:hypothetical protein [Chryseobacterium sp. POE27]|uniref:hypothetical protein n=1 Tax=Chryseobacterium sp. POE27 TaxID=3138177 RepID=UPI00321BB054
MEESYILAFFANTASRIAMQTAINNMSANASNNETRTSNPFTLNGLDIYYTKEAFPTGSMTVLTVNYYDVYPVGALVIPSVILGQEVLQDSQGLTRSTRTLPVAYFAKNIDDNNWTKVFNWYNLKGQIIGAQSINYFGGYTRTESLVDFKGMILQSKKYHRRTVNDLEVKVTETFEYDNQNRLLVHKHKVDNFNEEPLAINSYDELGRLQTKKTGKTDDDNYSPLQNIDYKYNIRGWLSGINDPDNLGGDFFAMKLKFNNPQDNQYGVSS